MEHLPKTKCIGAPYSQPELICDACPWIDECVKEVLK